MEDIGMTTIKNFSFISNQDDLIIEGLCVVPSDKVRGIIQIVHGMAEHKERYIDVMKTFAEYGFLCVVHDHRGHGKSIKKKEDLGYFYGTNGTALVEDIHQLTSMIKNTSEKIPYILLGHSMGSLAVRAYLKKYDKDIDGLIVCGSPSYNKTAKIARKLTLLMMKILGEKHRSKFIQKLMFGTYNKNFEEENGENSWICSDIDVVKKYDDDPLCGFIFTLNGFENLFSLMTETYDKDNWRKENLDMPILFIAGSMDPCIISKRHFERAVNFLKSVGYKNIIAKLYPDMRHEVLNEMRKSIVYNDVLNWIHTNFYKK